MAVQLRNVIRQNLELDVPIGKLFDLASIELLTDLLQKRAGGLRWEDPTSGRADHVEMI